MNDYFIGLDIGTDSIGWAVTDTNYNLMKFKGNAMWGVRMPEDANTAVERRGFRSSRRRTERNKFRISCLQMLFNEEIAKKDIAFFQRLKESNLYEEDKDVGAKYSVFADENYTDKDYHKDYPTIYHLRKELIDNPSPHDVRLVYLAIHHIIKNRGHFLFDLDLSDSESFDDFKKVWEELNNYIICNYNNDDCDFEIQVNDFDELESILKDKSISKSKKRDQICKLLNIKKSKDSFKCAVITAVVGNSVKPADLFNDESYKDCEIKNICVSNGYDENSIVYESTFGENFEFVEKIKSVYDWIVLADVLKGKKYLSYAKVDDYNKHKTDLKLLKTYVKEYCPEKYDLIFNVNKSGTENYVAYSRHSKSPLEKSCNQELFCGFLKKHLPKEVEDEKYQQMYNEIDACSFMPKMVTKNNSVVPMQAVMEELKAILKNAENYLNFLTETDEQGKTVSQKIIDTFTFKIPYYVGPLNTHSDKHWLVRTNEKIYPWNFEQVVDIDKSAENFINNLTSKCTYIPSADVIPKNSLLYSTFMVLNELNNLRINGDKISIETKQDLYNNVFLKYNKVTQAKIKNYLKVTKGIKDIEISGIDGDFKSNLKSYRDLDFVNISNEEKDEIIKAITIFGDDKKLLRKRLKKMFANELSEDEIKKICKLKYTGWSKLSKELLLDVEALVKENGEVTNVIHAMWDTNQNFMQIVASDDNEFRKAIDEFSQKEFTSLKQEVEDLYVSPKVKRPIYQTMKIVEEIVKIKKSAPKKIFVEVARGEEAKKRTVSRKNRLIELYESCKKDEEVLFNQLSNLKDDDLRQDKLYLYYTQFGKCMYSGESIDLSDLNNYDIDHIFPRSKIKDDSIDNRVLVKRVLNEEKGNDYPIKQSIRDDMGAFWRMLKDKGLISPKKYERLTRSSRLTEEDLSTFINRQLVETRQSTKAISQLLSKRYPLPNTEIVYVKANLASDFRHDYGFVKCREVNDLHHAKDAYLNIVVGNVYNTRFNHNKKIFISGLQSGKYSLNRMYDYNVDNAWVADNNESLNIVEKTMKKNNILFTRYSFMQKGGLFDQNILKKGKGQVPIKKNSALSDIEKYGGYNRATSTCFALVNYTDKKNKRIKAFIPIDLYKEKEYFENPEKYIESVLINSFNEVPTDISIQIPCVKYNTLISVNGFRMNISSKSGGGKTLVCKTAIQLVLSELQEAYIKKITNYLNKCSKMKDVKEITKYDHLSVEENMDVYETISNKLNNTVFNVKFSKLGKTLIDKKEIFENLSIYEQCLVLMQLLTILHANVRTGDLSLLGESKQSGTVTIGNKIEKSKTVNSFKIIHQSITGLFEKEIELLN